MIDPDSAAALVVQKMDAVRKDLLEERAKREREAEERARRELDEMERRNRERTVFRIGLAAHIAAGAIMVFVMVSNRQTLVQQRQDNLNASIAVGTCIKEDAPNLFVCAHLRFASLSLDDR